MIGFIKNKYILMKAVKGEPLAHPRGSRLPRRDKAACARAQLMRRRSSMPETGGRQARFWRQRGFHAREAR